MTATILQGLRGGKDGVQLLLAEHVGGIRDGVKGDCFDRECKRQLRFRMAQNDGSLKGTTGGNSSEQQLFI